MLAKLRAWWTRNVRQTSTITGLATLAIVASGVLTGTMPTALAINLAVGAVVAILLPGHDDAQRAANKAANDMIAMLDLDPIRRTAATAETVASAAAALQADLPEAVAQVVKAQADTG